jgi:hypothetical protein
VREGGNSGEAETSFFLKQSQAVEPQLCGIRTTMLDRCYALRAGIAPAPEPFPFKAAAKRQPFPMLTVPAETGRLGDISTTLTCGQYSKV